MLASALTTFLESPKINPMVNSATELLEASPVDLTSIFSSLAAPKSILSSPVPPRMTSFNAPLAPNSKSCLVILVFERTTKIVMDLISFFNSISLKCSVVTSLARIFKCSKLSRSIESLQCTLMNFSPFISLLRKKPPYFKGDFSY